MKHAPKPVHIAPGEPCSVKGMGFCRPATIIAVKGDKISVQRDKMTTIAVKKTHEWVFEADTTTEVEVFEKKKTDYVGKNNTKLLLGEKKFYREPPKGV